MSRARGMRMACGLALALASIAAPCAGQGDVDAAIEHAVQLRRDRRDEEALAEFRRIDAIHPMPRLRAQVALAEQALGRFRRAEDDLASALANEGDPWIAANRRALEWSRAEIASHLATLRASSNVAGARLHVGDDVAVAMPCTVRVEAGSVRLRVEAPRFDAIERTLTVTGGGVVDEDFTFAAPAMPTVATSGGSASSLELSPRPSPALARPSPAAGPTGDRRTWGWALLGTAAIPLAFGIVESVVREAHVRIYNDDARCPPGSKDAVCGDQRAAAETATIASAAGYASAVTLAAAGALLALVPLRERALRVSAAIGPSGGAIAVAGGF